MPKFMSRALPILAVAFAAASPAHASDARIAVSAFVPIRCEMTFLPTLDVTGTFSSLGVVQQYCNTRFQMRFSHVRLSADAIIGLGAATATPSGETTLIEPHGKPTISSSNLWLTSSDSNDAQAFANSVVIEVTPIGF